MPIAEPQCGAVGEALDQLRAGDLVMLHDTRRDEGDLIAAARVTTAATVAAMARWACGLISVALTPPRASALSLNVLQTRRAGGRELCDRTPSMVSVEARTGVSTGISSADRARTIATVGDPASVAGDLVSPGHVFPFVASEGGLLERYGRLEAAVDAVRLAGYNSAAAICDVLDADGDLAHADHLREVATELGIPVVSIAELLEARFADGWGA